MVAKMAAKKQRFAALRGRRDAFLARRPHRSFQLTRRRDYVRSLQLPGYIAFTFEVAKTLRAHKRAFILLVLFYALFSGALVGLASQDTYTTLTDELNKTGSQVFQGNWGQLAQAGLLFATVVSGSTSQTLQPQQQVYAVLLGLLAWLTTVWLLRNLLAGHKVKLRDGLYNAGSPIVATFFIFCIMLVQLLPVALAVLGYVAATQSQLLSGGGIAAALFWVTASGLGLLSLFWVTSTLIAFVVVTQPGMYPFRALRIAGDLVTGRRIRLLLRWVWLFVGVAVTWAAVMIPFILLDGWIKGMWPVVQWLPIIPVVLLLLSAASVVWIASYVYLLYRKVLADGANPA